MNRWIWIGIILIVTAAGGVAWQTQRAPGRVASSTTEGATPSEPARIAASSTTRPPKPPPGEPPEEVLLQFQREVYEELNRAGGMNVTVSASGRQIVLKPKLHSGRKDYCRPVPSALEGSFECGLDLRVTLREGDDTPGQHGERLFVHWDGVAGAWKRGFASDRPRARPRP